MSQPSITTRGSCGLIAGRRIVPPPPGPIDAPAVEPRVARRAEVAGRGEGGGGRAERQDDAASWSSCPVLLPPAPAARRRAPATAATSTRSGAGRPAFARRRRGTPRPRPRSRPGRTPRPSRPRSSSTSRPCSRCCSRPGASKPGPHRHLEQERVAVQLDARALDDRPGDRAERQVGGGPGRQHRVDEEVRDAGAERRQLLVAQARARA